MRAGVYVIENTITNEVYVGSSVNLDDRWAGHKSAMKLRRVRSVSRKLHEAWQQHGEKAFQFRPVLICAPEHLRMYETLAIQALDPAYNIRREDAATNKGIKFTEEAKARMKQHPRFKQHTVRGVTGTLFGLAKHFGVIHATHAWKRVAAGMTVEEAVLTPPIDTAGRTKNIVAVTKRNARKYTVQGVTGTLSELTAHFGVCSFPTVNKRVHSGWDVERAVTTPTRRYGP